MLIPIGTRVIRTGYPPDPYHGMKGTVIDHDHNDRSWSAKNLHPLRYNLVAFDARPWPRCSWVEGHAGVVPLTAIELLGELHGNAG